MRILVTGGAGQLGRALVRRGPPHEIVALDRAALDVCEPGAIERVLAAVEPEVVINAAAYTAVDRAELDRERVFAVNATAAGELARACASRGLGLLHISTEQVFDGRAARPYCEDDPRRPVNVYGKSKAAGEDAVLRANGTVIRTSWLFAAGGHGFVQAILANARREPVLRVVDDQRGCPTFVDDLAAALLVLASRPAPGAIYHCAGAPAVSRYEFARAIVDEARIHRALACREVEPIATPRDIGAPRPRDAVLDTTWLRVLGIAPAPWRPGLARVVNEELA